MRSSSAAIRPRRLQALERRHHAQKRHYIVREFRDAPGTHRSKVEPLLSDGVQALVARVDDRLVTARSSASGHRRGLVRG
jgi:hypothetical protein